MRGVKGMVAVMAAALVLVSLQAFAATDHTEFVKGPFKDGQSVTKVCLECHEKQAEEVMKTTHWTWAGTPNHVKRLENSTKTYGKKNMINSFCTTPFNGPDGVVHESCNKCHAGYGWTRSNNFDFTDKTRIDCLVCHALKGNYDRAAVGCDVNMQAILKGSMNLELAAQSVGRPNLVNCGYCHFYGGGGDAVKHAGLDSTLLFADKKQDVHMAKKVKGGQEMMCQDCHKTKEHRIAGASSQMAHYDARVTCEDCHSGAKAPHQKSKNKNILNNHLTSVACQTCHIPVFAKGQATKMMWKWSDVGKDIEPQEEFDKETFAKKKGTFKWGMNVVPDYEWYNGKIDRYMLGDKIKDPSKPVIMTRPLGDIKDKTAKIYPYKRFTGTQPMDSKFKYLSTFQQYKELWVNYDWEKALVNGAKSPEGLPYSGKYQFVNTVSYISAQHEVSPKEDALQCGECHMGGTRMNWTALGYKGDPMQYGGRAAVAPKKSAKKKK
ncbi:MAG: tetrathionate reductase family octaheme c-type cytochrome [Desulfuromonadaceae bacterium]|nr:tetrathionate reductase family octaheme c-type cytochrome [Desulfuromonadaceae bacterium]